MQIICRNNSRAWMNPIHACEVVCQYFTACCTRGIQTFPDWVGKEIYAYFWYRFKQLWRHN